jgi:molybdenum cofactor cytidylyltransferase
VARNAQIGAVVLAAGASRRFGEANKLLAQIDGRSLIDIVLDAIAGAKVSPLVVVTGWDQDNVTRAIGRRSIQLVHNDDWDAGMGGSIGLGVDALSAATAGALIVPGDMPLLTPAVVGRLIDAFEQDGRERVVYPTTKAGEQRNPVLWPRRFFGDLKALPAAAGAKALLQQLASEDRYAVAIDNDGVFLDVDTEAELNSARTLGE